MGIGRQDRIAIVLPNGQTATTPSSAGRVLRKLATAENFEGFAANQFGEVGS